MFRGKQQVLLNYLPNKTFDFASVASIARVISIHGEPRTDLNILVVLRRIADQIRAWQEEFRPVLQKEIFRQPNRFVLLNPRSVQSELFPKVLWCQNPDCSRVFDYRNRDSLPNVCQTCRQGRLVQLRFVKIHRCGALQPLLPPLCRHCRTSNHMALDTRGSERISNFKWVCRRCNKRLTVFGGNCNECQWPDQSLRKMDIEVHRSGRSYYAHTTTMLNIPHRRLDGFFSLSEWPAFAAAKFLGMPEVANQTLSDYGSKTSDPQNVSSPGLSGDDLDNLMQRKEKGELTPEKLVLEIQRLREQRLQEQNVGPPGNIVQILSQRTGVSWPVWQKAGQEMLEAIMPLEAGQPTEINFGVQSEHNIHNARQMGLSRLILVSDYPILTAAFGYSRAEYRPNQCRLNPFPAHPEYSGRFPIFVDQIQADALLLNLNPERVISWLEQNGCKPIIPNGSDQQLSRRAYFVQLFSDVSFRETITASQRGARMVFGLLHTLSHLFVRQAALLCGLDHNSISEYLLPSALTFAIYSNHRFGATIGALTALYEQSLAGWFNAVRETRRCVYDPVCRDTSGNCHACTHLAETSCHFFNLNLNRAFLFGGHDTELGDIGVGFFDHSLT